MKKKKILAVLLICIAILGLVGGVAFYQLTHPFKVEAASLEIYPIDNKDSMDNMIFYHNNIANDPSDKIFYNPEFKINEDDFENYCEIKVSITVHNKGKIGWVLSHIAPKKYGKVFGFEDTPVKLDSIEANESAQVKSFMYIYRNGMDDESLRAFLLNQKYDLVYEDNKLGEQKITVKLSDYIK